MSRNAAGASSIESAPAEPARDPGGGGEGAPALGAQSVSAQSVGAHGVGGLARRLLRDPLFRNAHALNLSTGVSSLAGLGFWLVVARRYDLDDVGRNAAAISSLMFLGGVAQLNLSSALVRFVPVAGERTLRLVLSVYATAAVVAVGLGAGFVVIAPRLVPELHFLGANPLLAGWFVLSCAVWAVFVLEDGALTGLRRAVLVPVENGAFSLAKVIAALALAPLLPSSGIFVAWTGCTLLTVVPTNAYVLIRAIPAHASASRHATGHAIRRDAGVPLARQLLGYVPLDFAGSLCWLAATSLLPVVVISIVGAANGAVLNLCWVVAYGLYLVSINLGSSLVVESAGAEESSLLALCSSVRRHLLALLTPTVIAVVALDHVLLGLFGARYGHGGPVLLDLLALSALPFVVVATSVSANRAKRRTGPVAALNAALLLGVAGVTSALLARHGVLAVGIAWLASQSALAAVVLVLEHRQRIVSGTRAGAHVGPAGAASLVASMGAMQLARLAARARPPRWLVVVAGKRALLESRHVVREILPQVVERLGLDEEPPDITILAGGSDRAVAQLRLGGEGSQLLVKVARSELGTTELRRERAVLEQLHADERLGEWRLLLPRWRPAEGDPRLVLESILPGSDVASLLRQTPARALDLARLGLEAVRPLHTRTTEERVVGEAELARWFGPPLQLLAELHPSGLVPAHQRAAIELVTQRLRAATAGRRLTLSWTHGDYTPGNLLVDAGRGVVTGIVDWSEAAPDCSPVLDAVLWIAAMHCQLSGEQLGSLVSRVLRGQARSGAEAGATARDGCEAESLTPSRRPDRVWARLLGLLDSSAAGVGVGELDIADALLWAWLDHVTRNLSKSSRYLRSRLWWMGNVDAVLRTVCELGPGAASRAGELGAGATSGAGELGARATSGAGELGAGATSDAGFRPRAPSSPAVPVAPAHAMGVAGARAVRRNGAPQQL